MHNKKYKQSGVIAALLSDRFINYKETTDTHWEIIGDKKAQKTAIKTIDLWPTTLSYRVRNRFTRRVGFSEPAEKFDSIEDILPTLQKLHLYNPE